MRHDGSHSPGAAQILLFSWLALGSGAQVACRTTSATPAKEAETLAGITRLLIESGDAIGLLEHVAPDGLRCIDGHVTLAELRTEFAARHGENYAEVFDTRGLHQWWRETRGSEPSPELVSYQEFFKSHPEVSAQFAVSKNGKSGDFFWKVNTTAIEVYSPIFQWKWDSARKRPAIFSIGCWMG
jgi:hypothetical protein